MAKYIKGSHNSDYIKIVYSGSEFRIDFAEGKPITTTTPVSADDQPLGDHKTKSLLDTMLSTFEAAPDQTDKDKRDIFIKLPWE